MPECSDDLTEADVVNNSAHLAAHLAATAGPPTGSDSLFPHIDTSKCDGLNMHDVATLPRILRPLDTRDVVRNNDEVTEEEDFVGGVWTAGACESQDGDDDLLLNIKFTSLCRVKSLLISTGGGRAATSPTRVAVFVNRGQAGLSFDDIQSGLKAEQEFELRESADGHRGSEEYMVKLAKFSNVSELSLYFSNAVAGNQSRLYYLGFKGSSRVYVGERGESLSVGAENAADSMVDGVKEDKRSGGSLVR